VTESTDSRFREEGFPHLHIIITTEREELRIQPDVVARRQEQLASAVRTQRR
jgi:hypothetical protein